MLPTPPPTPPLTPPGTPGSVASTVLPTTPAYSAPAPMAVPRPRPLGERAALLQAQRQAEQDVWETCVLPAACWVAGAAATVWCLCPPCGR